ncbi:MAG: TetR family transcriptional regulator [Acidobacteriota bacterium]
MESLRQRNRIRAMREAQRVALRLFEHRGFDQVTVEEIARDSGMAASTIFRHFGTKEYLVLWDEHADAVDAALAARLGRQPPHEAIRDALLETLAVRFEAERDFQLARLRLIFGTESLHGAAVEDDLKARHDLAEAIADVLPAKDRSAAPLLAGAAVLGLEIALERWQAPESQESLADLIRDAYDMLGDLASIGS